MRVQWFLAVSRFRTLVYYTYLLKKLRKYSQVLNPSLINRFAKINGYELGFHFDAGACIKAEDWLSLAESLAFCLQKCSYRWWGRLDWAWFFWRGFNLSAGRLILRRKLDFCWWSWWLVFLVVGVQFSFCFCGRWPSYVCGWVLFWVHFWRWCKIHTFSLLWWVLFLV